MSRRYLFAVLASLCAVSLLVTIDNTVVNVALPTFARVFGATNQQLQWIADGYTITFACFLLLFGAVADRFGSKKILLMGLFFFTVISFLYLFIDSMSAIILFRFLLGRAAAAMYPCTLSLINYIFRGTRYYNAAIGSWTAVSGLGIALGPIVGGLLLKFFSWKAIFLINVPIALIALVLIFFLVKENATKADIKINFGSAFISVIAIACITWYLIESPSKGWLVWQQLLILAFGLVLAVIYVFNLIKAKDDYLDARIFAQKEFITGSLGVATCFFCLFGFIFLITTYFQSIKNYSALTTGFALLPYAFFMVLISALAPVIMKRVKTYWMLIVVGLIILSLGYIAVVTLSANSNYWWGIVPPMSLMAIGMATVQTPGTMLIMRSSNDNNSGSISAVNDTLRQLAGTFGVAVSGSISGSKFKHYISSNENLIAAKANLNENIVGLKAYLAYFYQTNLRELRQIFIFLDDCFIKSLHAASIFIGVFGLVIALIICCINKIDLDK